MQNDPSDAEDLKWVQDFLAGDPRAFERLFDKYREKVYRIAYRFVHDKEDALEITQEVFIRVHQGLPGFKTGSKFFTWLYRIAVNRSIDAARARRSRRTIALDHQPAGAPDEGESLADRLPHPDAESPPDLIERQELAEKLLQALERLSPKHKAVFVLHAMEDLSYKEIAGVVGCSLGPVRSRLFYTRKKLKDILVEYGEPRKVAP